MSALFSAHPSTHTSAPRARTRRPADTLKLPDPRLLALRFEAVPRRRTLRMTQLRPVEGNGNGEGKARESDSDSDDVDDAELLRLEEEDAERCRLEREAQAEERRLKWEAAERELAERYPGLNVSGTRPRACSSVMRD